MKAKQLEKLFDDGKDITQHLDLSKARRPEQEQKRVNIRCIVKINYLNILCHVNDETNYAYYEVQQLLNCITNN